MAEVLRWILTVMGFGGMAVALVGLVWWRTVRLLRAFGRPIKSNIGIWLALGGIAASLTGFSLLYSVFSVYASTP